MLPTVVLVLICLADPGPRIELSTRDSKATVHVLGLDTGTLKQLGQLDADKLSKVFRIEVAGTDAGDRPAMLGSYRVEKQALRFEPRFPLVPGLRYRAVYQPDGGKAIEAVLELPRRPGKPPLVTAVYPSGDRLPENLLRFYVHFSEPMTQGDSYRHIRLLEPGGQAVDLPFLELDQELWDPAGKRFTLFFDPGRVKRGLKPREEVGPALVEGRYYTLVINTTWEGADGTPLKAVFRKRFFVTPPDDQPPDVKTWKIESPPVGSRQPLLVRFPKSMDHALLDRMIQVRSPSGTAIAGTNAVSKQETIWQFIPETPWQVGRHHLVVDTRLEDPSGNSIGRPFEVDLLRPVERKTKVETVEVPFQIVQK